MFKNGTPEKLSVAAQGFMINTEHSYIKTEVLRAVEAHGMGRPAGWYVVDSRVLLAESREVSDDLRINGRCVAMNSDELSARVSPAPRQT